MILTCSTAEKSISRSLAVMLIQLRKLTSIGTGGGCQDTLRMQISTFRNVWEPSVARQRNTAPPAKVLQQRSPLNMKASPQLRAQIETAAKANGLSLTQEVERRLIDSFQNEGLLGGPETTSFFRMLAGGIAVAQSKVGGHWLKDFATFHTAKRLIEAQLEEAEPLPPKIASVMEASRAARAAEKEEKDAWSALIENAPEPPFPSSGLLNENIRLVAPDLFAEIENRFSLARRGGPPPQWGDVPTHEALERIAQHLRRVEEFRASEEGRALLRRYEEAKEDRIKAAAAYEDAWREADAPKDKALQTAQYILEHRKMKQGRD